ncbi:hypothetical protein PANDA_019091 [Ailuropoda melanoleuca]|uniref:Uncharacterized protein n=1 Tax=Ailuropoda melanoleuca TaxID=9646 RepID=D2I1C6_AILME|nr:hypothetical protein PANDA_019091 [Ailuropoda melanoleuca]
MARVTRTIPHGSPQLREAHQHPRSSHDPAGPHVEHRDPAGDPQSQTTSWVPHFFTKSTPDDQPSKGEERSLLSNIYFLFLVFLEVPVLLSMLSAVLWVNRPQGLWVEVESAG